METANDNNKPVKFNPGPKGILAMNGRSKDEAKEYRRTYIEFVRETIAKGYTYQMKLDAISIKFGVSVRQAKNYVKDAREDMQKRKAETLEQAKWHYMKATEGGDGKLAREWWNEIAKLEGLYAAKQTVNLNRHEFEAKSTVADTIDVTDLVIMESILNKKKE